MSHNDLWRSTAAVCRAIAVAENEGNSAEDFARMYPYPSLHILSQALKHNVTIPVYRAAKELYPTLIPRYYVVLDEFYGHFEPEDAERRFYRYLLRQAVQIALDSQTC